VSHTEYAELGRRMRDAQKRFFKGDKSAAAVAIAKRLEKEFDDETERRLGVNSPTLFDLIDRTE
jgi:hypothetical protein